MKSGLVFDSRIEIAPAGPGSLLRTNALTLKDKVEVGKVLTRLPKLRAGDYIDVTVNDWIDDIVSGERPAEMTENLSNVKFAAVRLSAPPLKVTWSVL